MTNRIKELREARGLSQEELAAMVNTSGQQIGRLENGSRRLTVEWLMRLGKALSVAPSELLPRDEKGQPSRMTVAGDRVYFGSETAKMVPHAEPPLDGRRSKQIPVYAGGGERQPFIVIDPIDYRMPPPELVSVRDAYGVLITGESMAPAFEPGDIGWVNPHMPPQPDTFVVLYHLPMGEAEAMVSRLVSWTSDEWMLRQYQPKDETFAVARTDWPAVHRIVGKKMK